MFGFINTLCEFNKNKAKITQVANFLQKELFYNKYVISFEILSFSCGAKAPFDNFMFKFLLLDYSYRLAFLIF